MRVAVIEETTSFEKVREWLKEPISIDNTDVICKQCASKGRQLQRVIYTWCSSLDKHVSEAALICGHHPGEQFTCRKCKFVLFRKGYFIQEQGGD